MDVGQLCVAQGKLTGEPSIIRGRTPVSIREGKEAETLSEDTHKSRFPLPSTKKMQPRSPMEGLRTTFARRAAMAACTE